MAVTRLGKGARRVQKCAGSETSSAPEGAEDELQCVALVHAVGSTRFTPQHLAGLPVEEQRAAARVAWDMMCRVDVHKAVVTPDLVRMLANLVRVLLVKTRGTSGG